MERYPDEVRQAARSLYLRRYSIGEISETLHVPKRTLYYWADTGDWNDLLSHETVEEAIQRRLAVLIERDNKSKAELGEVDRLVANLERLRKLSGRVAAAQGRQPERGDEGKGGARKGGGKARKIKNDVSMLTPQDFKDKFHARFYRYQHELRAAKAHRNRQILKSRQIGATWYFAQEALEDACTTGDNQIFLSATRAQSEVFRTYIIQFAVQDFDIELKGNPIILNTAHGQAELHFLSNNSKSAQSYHGHVYIDEYFWIQRFNELYKVATGMASQKKWRRTLFSTPSAVTHDAYDLWTGDRYNERFKKKRVEFPGFKERQSGILCPDNTWRKIITLKDAEAGGCDLFDMADLKLEYSTDEFRNLFMCQFVDDTQGVFRLRDLEACYADAEDWADWNPDAPRPFGNCPVWIGYDPSRTRDDASLVVMAPPLEPMGEHRILERHKWLDQSYTWQAERIKELTQRYNVQHIGIDTTGPGIGVYDIVRSFYPAATPIHYSVQTKNQLVLKAKDVIGAGRIKWDGMHNDIPHAFLTIRQGTTDSGMMTYSAARSSKTGHADVAWAIMHALAREPLNSSQQNSSCVAIG